MGAGKSVAEPFTWGGRMVQASRMVQVSWTGELTGTAAGDQAPIRNRLGDQLQIRASVDDSTTAFVDGQKISARRMSLIPGIR